VRGIKIHPHESVRWKFSQKVEKGFTIAARQTAFRLGVKKRVIQMRIQGGKNHRKKKSIIGFQRPKGKKKEEASEFGKGGHDKFVGEI